MGESTYYLLGSAAAFVIGVLSLTNISGVAARSLEWRSRALGMERSEERERWERLGVIGGALFCFAVSIICFLKGLGLL